MRFIIFVISFFIWFFVITPLQNSAQAASCTVATVPAEATTNTRSLKLIISSDDLANGTYRIGYVSPGGSPSLIANPIFTFSNGKGEVDISKPQTWVAGSYLVYIMDNRKGQVSIKDNADCSSAFIIRDGPLTNPTQSCTTNIESTAIIPSTEVVLIIKGNLPNGDYKIFINGQEKLSYSRSTGDRINLGAYPTGDHKVEIKKNCSLLDAASCSETINQCTPIGFRVGPIGSTTGGEIKAEDTKVALTNFCINNPGVCSTSVGEKCIASEGVMTAIGCIPTQPQKLVEGLLRYGTLAGGGVAFLLMLLASIQMITAEGNPNTIKTSQEKFYSAIIGLLLIIFSVLLMQVIGVDLLGLKNFGR